MNDNVWFLHFQLWHLRHLSLSFERFLSVSFMHPAGRFALQLSQSLEREVQDSGLMSKSLRSLLNLSFGCPVWHVPSCGTP